MISHGLLIMLNLHVALRDEPSPSEIVYGSSLTLPADHRVDLVIKNDKHIIHNPADFSHCLKVHYTTLDL